MVEVLALHGSPGSGKTTLARELSETMRMADIAHGLVDLDDLSIVHPYAGPQFSRDNLRAVFPNYVAAAPGLHLIVPLVFNDEDDVDLLKAAVPGARLIVCETTAPIDVLKKRVTAREPTEEWRRRLRDFVDLYRSRDDHVRIRDFQVSTYPATVAESAAEILEKAGWLTPSGR
ncbi:hypothetical protein KOI35_17535 [Actinoplanes bogorensis]|uniref:Shikimate kinase n=1 Tax=Paractinoplanes bogorensis TaxID=1610840 RepID=A0ABS5YTD8_9ACTN|nr:hypothetical protein [Actinoplanes bogorensis]MBU2665310.1 hypothetical protein [Actinoplanes bogorensis]